MLNRAVSTIFGRPDKAAEAARLESDTPTLPYVSP